MIYRPHQLELRKKPTQERNDDGDLIVQEAKWEAIGLCRCDDASTITLRGEDGKAYNPNYKIVFDKSTLLSVGDEVRALRADGTVRGAGFIKSKTECNYLNYQAVLL